MKRVLLLKFLLLFACKGGLVMENLFAGSEELKGSIPYEEVDVSFNNGESEVTLSGTLTLPSKDEKHAAVILISGSGPLDRDSTFLDHKPFLFIADDFARKGVAVLRFDKRGVGKSKGDFTKATIEDFVQDVIDAIEYLKSRKEINPSRIGLIGHSEGGLIASMVAAKSEDVAFIVMIAGPALPIKDNTALVFTLLVNEDENDTGKSETDRMVFSEFFNIVTRDNKTLEEKKKAVEIAERMLPRINEESKATLGFLQIEPEVFISIFNMVPSMKGFLDISPEYYLTKIKCPVLAVYSSKDVQVPAKENAAAMSKALKQSGNPDYTIIEISNVNHLFQKCETGYPSEYVTSGRAMVSEVLDLISAWFFHRI